MFETALRASLGPVVPMTASVVGPQQSWSAPEQLARQTSSGPLPPGTLVASSDSPTTASLVWPQVEGNTGYRVERAAGNGAFSIVATLPIDQTTFTDVGLTTSVNYRYRVSTLSGSTLSIPSPIASVTPAVATNLAAPSGLAAERPSATQVRLSWQGTDSSMAVLIQRSLDGGVTWNNLATLSGSSTSYTDNVLRNTLYSYRLQASNFNAISPFTGSVSVLTPPADVVSFLRTGVTTQTANLNWTAVQGATGYLIEQSKENAAFETVATIAGGVTQTTITGLESGTQYRYRIRATNAGGASNPTSLNGVLTIADAPRGLTAEQTSASTIQLAFQPVKGAASYVIERRSDGTIFTRLTTLNGSLSSYTDIQVSLGESYEYRVKAVNESGDSEYSELARVNMTIAGALPVPQELTLAQGPKAATLVRWTLEDNGTPVSSFVIQRQVGSQWRTLGVAPASAREFTVRGLQPGQTANVRVLSTGAGTLGRPSREILAVAAPAPTARVRHLIPPTDTAVTLTWSPPRGAASYTLQRSVDRTNWDTVASGFQVAAYVDETVQPGQSYSYRVFASNDGGDGLPSTAFSVLTAPPTPTNVFAEPAVAPARGSLVYWNDVFGETQYRVQGSIDGVSWSNAATARADATSATVRNTRFQFFRVAAVNRSGTSPYSAPVGLPVTEVAPAPMAAVFSATVVPLGPADSPTRDLFG